MRTRYKIVLVAAGLLAIWPIVWTARIVTFVVRLGRMREQQRQKLLYETDHEELLRACRLVLKETGEGKWEYQSYNIRSNRHPDANQFPEVLLELNPSYVSIGYVGDDSDPRIMIFVEMMGGLTHVGVAVYPEDYNGPLHMGGRQLIEGLWFYED